MATSPTCRARDERGEEACPADGPALLPDEAFAAADREFEPGDLVGEDRVGPETRSGTPMGTPLDMPPEQIRGGPIDHRADIDAFGVLVHEVLTGEVPFEGTSVIDVLMKHTSAQAPATSSVRPELPRALDAPVLHMLEKEPDQRPSSIVAAVDALLLAAGAPAATPA